MRKAKREFSVIMERDEGDYYVGSVPEFPGCHSRARSLYKAIDRIREAIQLCLDVEEEGQRGVPRSSSEEAMTTNGNH